MKKIIVIIISFVFLGACAQSTALIGPAITIGNTGNVMQAGFSYGSNMMIKNTTGKTPTEHATSYVDKKREEKKIRKEMISYLATHMEVMRIKLSAKK